MQIIFTLSIKPTIEFESILSVVQLVRQWLEMEHMVHLQINYISPQNYSLIQTKISLSQIQIVIEYNFGKN